MFIRTLWERQGAWVRAQITEDREEVGKGSKLSMEGKQEGKWPHKRPRRAGGRGQDTDSDNGGHGGRR